MATKKQKNMSNWKKRKGKREKKQRWRGMVRERGTRKNRKATAKDGEKGELRKRRRV